MDNRQITMYRKLLDSGELLHRAELASQHLTACNGCALYCKVDRLSGKLGACKIGKLAKISSYGPHHGEEAPLRGWRGSGTIFFTRCNLHCQYCQNHDISQSNYGEEIESTNLAAIMLELQKYGCHNINLVSPSHVVPQILAALLIAAKSGLSIPLVYNTGGYDSIEMLSLLDGVIDIYMPDMKYSDAQTGLRYSKIPNYPAVNRIAIKEMHRQVGDLQIDAQGLAMRGLLVRHLVLPGGLAGTKEIVDFIVKEISPDTYLNLMDQYRPAYKASHFPELNRYITHLEYSEAVNLALNAGLHRLDKRRFI